MLLDKWLTMTADDVYKEFIDGLVGLSGCVEANRVRKPEWWHMEPPQVQALLNSLSAEHREVIAEMLDGTRTSAIHDVLVYLEWKHQISRDGVLLDEDAFNSTLHHSYVARLSGDEWPEWAE